MKLLILLLIASCASYFPPIRGQYTLTSKKQFMYSNMYVNPSNLEESQQFIHVYYDVIVKNIDKVAHDIDLTKSTISFAKNIIPISCSRYNEKDMAFKIEAGAQTRINCLAQIDKKLGTNSDFQSIIEIPLAQDKAKFEYLLRAEDFK